MKHPKYKPDTLDIHQETALMLFAANSLAAIKKNENGYTTSQEILLKYKSDPNYMCGRLKRTPLEAVIDQNPNSPVIADLVKRTKLTNELLARCQEMLNDAMIEPEESLDRINILFDLKLAKKKSVSSNPSLHETSDVSHGYWMRIIRRPDEEEEILKKREALSDRDLAMMRHVRATVTGNPNYTRYSSCTYVKAGLPIKLFKSKGSGFMIRSSEYPIHHWYDGHREIVTDNILILNSESFNNGETQGQHLEITAKKVENILSKMFDDLIKKHEKEIFELKNAINIMCYKIEN